jgi:outer membrane receptor protein involved in Fe transport
MISKTAFSKRLSPLLSLAAFAAIADVSSADAATDETDPFYAEIETSLATGYSLPQTRAPAIATVITAQQIEKLGATTVADVLRTVPGLHVSTARGVNDVFVIRGFYDEFNSYVLLLLNGIPINNAVNGGRPQAWRMPVHNIARIEIMRGPGSALYGADAAAGVVNIVTKTAREIGGVYVGAYGGSFETGGAWLQSGGRWGDLEAAFSVEASTTEGYRKAVRADDQTRIDGLLGTRASLAPGPINTRRDDLDARLDLKGERWRFRAGHQGFLNVGTGAGIVLALDPAGEFDVGLTNADFTYDLVKGDQWDVTAQLSYLGTTTEASLTPFPPGAFGGLFKDGVRDRFRFRVDETRGEVTALYGGIPDHRLRFGAGVSHSRLADVAERRNFRTGPGGVPLPTRFADVGELGEQPLLSEEERTLWYALVQDEWVVAPDWILTAGIRLDDYSDFGATVNPRLALVWNPSPTLTAKALYGRAFRAPTFAELYGNNLVAVAGNPDLEPAIVNMVELSLDKAWSPRARTKAILYGYDLDNQIFGGTTGTTDSPLAKVQKQNRAGRRGYGAELEADYRATPDLVLQASYAYYGFRASEPNDLGRWAPEHQVYAALDWRLAPDWSLNARLKWVGDRRLNFDGEDAYLWAGATLRRVDPRGWEVSVTLDNLFDADAAEPAFGLPHGIPLPGRSVMAQFGWRLQ